jgi:zinc protease
VKAAAAKYLNKDHAVVVYCVPGKKVLDDVPRSPADTDADVKLVNPYTPEFEAAQEWRKNKPDPGPSPVMHLPAPQEFTLANGLKVFLVENHALPILSAEVISRAGSENDPAAKSGLATLTAEVMGDGTASRDLTQLATDEERIGAHVETAAGLESSVVSIDLLTSHLADGMNLLADVAEHPGFRTDDVERRRKQRLVRIEQETDNVQNMALRVGPKLVFGDEPYGRSGTGTADSVGSITQGDLPAFYAAHYGPRDSALVLAGDVTRPQAENLAREYFGKWEEKTEAVAEIPPAPEPQPTHVVIVDKPGAPQTSLEAFGVGVAANSPDDEALTVMNYTLGASFASRINMNLREVHGYTYGARSGFSEYVDGGLFSAGGLVRTDVTADAAKQLMAEIRNFPAKPSTADELAAAKEASVRSLPGHFETTSAVVRAVDGIFLYSRPLDYYTKLPAKYEAITQEDIARVANQYLHPDQLVIIAAGDRAKIEPALKDAELGPVEVRDVNGKLVSEQP